MCAYMHVLVHVLRACIFFSERFIFYSSDTSRGDIVVNLNNNSIYPRYVYINKLHKHNDRVYFCRHAMKAATVPHLGTEDASFPRNELTNLQKASDAHDATPPSLAVGASSPIPLTFPQFAAAYSSRLPQIVKLGGDYIDPMGNRVVQSGETLKVLHIKNATVADTQVYRGDTTVTTVTTVLNSRDRISIIYVPDNDLNRALAGVTFKTVQHMCQAKQMPKAVGVLKAWRNDETFIDKYDVLILRKKYKRRGKSGVHAFSTRYKNDLFLPDSCNGMFTTVPDMVSLRLTEITSLLSDILPVTVYNVINKQCLTLIRHEVQPVIFAQVVDHHPPLELELPVSDSFLRFIVRHPPSTTVARDVLGTATGLGNIKEVRSFLKKKKASMPRPPPRPQRHWGAD